VFIVEQRYIKYLTFTFHCKFTANDINEEKFENRSILDALIAKKELGVLVLTSQITNNSRQVLAFHQIISRTPVPPISQALHHGWVT